MTVRNVGIVFAPTLNIPAPVFSMFLTDFDPIFGDDPPPEVTSPDVMEITDGIPSKSDGVRSPRHQMYSDLPTPSYDHMPSRARGMADGGSSQANDSNGYRDLREKYDTGFNPMNQAYDQSATSQRQPQPPQSQSQSQHQYHSSMDGMLTPSNVQATTKSKRRESSMLFMSMEN